MGGSNAAGALPRLCNRLGLEEKSPVPPSFSPLRRECFFITEYSPGSYPLGPMETNYGRLSFLDNTFLVVEGRTSPMHVGETLDELFSAAT